MSPVIRNILFVVVGLIVGSLVNMGLIQLGMALVAAPPGLDLSTPDGLKAAMPLLSAQHFIFPFLAHALGVLVGAYIATRWSHTTSRTPAMIIAGLFFIGGLTTVFMMPGAPIWFIALDLLVAYFPMGMLGYKLGKQSTP